MNHYVMNQYFNRGGRHYWIAEQLKQDGFEPVVFGCNAKQDADEDFFQSRLKWHVERSPSGVPYVPIRSIHYKGNGISRIENMLLFTMNLLSVAKEYAKEFGPPEVVYASSVHPLTVFAGEQIARHFKVPCIGEVRDLWPETLVAYGAVKGDSPIGKLLYAGEKLMYRRADAMVFTMEGAPDYIREHGWDKEHGGPIDLNRVYNINNGVDLALYMHGRVLEEEKDLDGLFALYRQWGLAGLKPGFVRYGDAESTDWNRMLVETAARHNLWLDIHDSHVPDGMQRTYPNLRIRTCCSARAAAARRGTIPCGRTCRCRSRGAWWDRSTIRPSSSAPTARMPIQPRCCSSIRGRWPSCAGRRSNAAGGRSSPSCSGCR